MSEQKEDNFKEKILDLDDLIKEKKRKKQFLFFFFCGSTNVKQHFYGVSAKQVALSPKVDCVKCKFHGFMIRGTIEELKKFKEELKKGKVMTERNS